MSKVIAIDPTGCGCTECVVGEYVPFNRATKKQLRQMLKGKIRNNTSLSGATIKERVNLLKSREA
jgi:hypothetical protein